MGVEVREVRISDWFDASMDLARVNWAETGFDFELAPEKERYQALQDMGMLLVVAALDGDTLVGYALAYLAPHTFNPSVVCCMTEALFVQEAYRGGRAAPLLIRETERLAKERGASIVMWATRAGTSLADTLMRRGYQLADIVVMKGL